MPLDSSVAARLRKYYGPFPGPDADLFIIGERVSQFLIENGVTEEGVIAVALSNFPYYYLNFSPGLQRAVRETISSRILVLGPMLEKATGKKFILRVAVPGGGDVAPAIIDQVGEDNPGCAEKKIITAIERYGEKMTAFSVVAHPADNYLNRTSSAHVVLGDSSQTYIAPCRSCLLVGEAHKATLGHAG
ncbi:MAG: hypothetical protein QOH06_5421 [Acidobacteriota bacterium]|jgi:hypothetical protein|nr:hypothetical protein [Acidobacteriota bacterium]